MAKRMMLPAFAFTVAAELYCPGEKDMNIDYDDGTGGNVKFHSNGWTINGSGRVSSKTSWNLINGSIEFDIDVSGAQAGVNTNVYTSSPSKPNCGKDCYCDVQDNDSPVCMEMDILENNGKCKMASTWHSAGGTGGNKGYCDAWGCAALADLPSSGKFHIKSLFTVDGDWQTTLDGTPVNTWGSEKPVAKDREIVKSTMSSIGGVIESSQWTGWVPGSGCPSGGDLQKSVFTVSNVRVTGTVIQGPVPTKCTDALLV